MSRRVAFAAMCCFGVTCVTESRANHAARRRAKTLLGHAQKLPAGKRDDVLLGKIERELDALRAQGYRENADGSWVTPDGRVIRH